MLFGKNLDIAASKLILHPGSTLNMTGAGFEAEEGPGAGQLVSPRFYGSFCANLFTGFANMADANLFSLIANQARSLKMIIRFCLLIII